MGPRRGVGTASRTIRGARARKGPGRLGPPKRGACKGPSICFKSDWGDGAKEVLRILLLVRRLARIAMRNLRFLELLLLLLVVFRDVLGSVASVNIPSSLSAAKSMGLGGVFGPESWLMLSLVEISRPGRGAEHPAALPLAVAPSLVLAASRDLPVLVSFSRFNCSVTVLRDGEISDRSAPSFDSRDEVDVDDDDEDDDDEDDDDDEEDDDMMLACGCLFLEYRMVTIR